MQDSRISRRAVLSTVGVGIGAGVIGSTVTAQQETESNQTQQTSNGTASNQTGTSSGQQGAATEYSLVQGDGCVSVQPIQGDVPVEEFYGYRLPEDYVSDENGAIAGSGPSYTSSGTTDLQRPQTSVAFLYQGPQRLSFVVVHGSADSPNGGAATFKMFGLPEDGEWIVKDDLFRDPETGDIAEQSYDNWQSNGGFHQVDWTWGSNRTDGGAFGGLGEDFQIVINPAFNEAAALHNEYYEGTVQNWEFLSGGQEQERISLNMDESLGLATGSCEEVSSSEMNDTISTGNQSTGAQPAGNQTTGNQSTGSSATGNQSTGTQPASEGQGAGTSAE